MANKLSHSSVNKFSDCAKSYYFHYVERLRGTTQSAALLFGTAIDKATEDLVQTGDLELAKNTFLAYWVSQEINGVNTDLRNNADITYAANDTDLELLNEATNVMESINNVVDKKKDVGLVGLTAGERLLFNQVNWDIAKKRGELMLEAVNEQIVPKITKLHSTQEKIDLTNDSGDTVVGYVDLVADMVGYSSPIVLDFKTASRPYEEDSVKTSPQLALYVHAVSEKYRTRKAGFIVLSKAIQKNRKKICSECGNDGSGGRHKTCDAMISPPMDGPGTGKPVRCNGAWTETINPKCTIQVIIDDIPERLEDIVLENMDNTNKAINNGIFARNLNSCVKPYGKCTFYGLCHHNSMEGLVKV